MTSSSDSDKNNPTTLDLEKVFVWVARMVALDFKMLQ